MTILAGFGPINHKEISPIGETLRAMIRRSCPYALAEFIYLAKKSPPLRLIKQRNEEQEHFPVGVILYRHQADF
jgi:hypothetical protein